MFASNPARIASKGSEGSGRGLRDVPGSMVRKAGVLAEIRTRHLQDASQKRHRNASTNYPGFSQSFQANSVIVLPFKPRTLAPKFVPVDSLTM